MWNLTKRFRFMYPKFALAILFGVISHLSVLTIPLSAYLYVQDKKVVYLVLIIIAPISRAVFRYLEQLCNHDIAFKILSSLRHDLFQSLRQKNMSFFVKQNYGDFISSVSQDIENLEIFFAHTISPIFIAIIFYGLIAMIFVSYDIKLALSLLVFYLLNGWIVPRVSHAYFQDEAKAYRENIAILNTKTYENVAGRKTFNEFAQVNRRLKQISIFTDQANQQHSRLLFSSHLAQWIFQISFIFVLGILLLTRTMDPMFSSILFVFSLGPLLALSNLSYDLHAPLASADRLLSMLSYEQNDKDVVEEKFEVIRFLNASFSYDGKEKILDSFNAVFKQDTRYGIYGPSGIGKSSLLHLIMGFYQIEDGDLKIDGQNKKDIRAILLMQENHIFEMSVYDNLSLGESYSKKEMEEVCRKVNLHDRILRFEHQYEEILKDNLSSGEKQRLALARVLLRQPDLLLLDEFTSHLDVYNEALVLDALDAFDDIMIIMVSHRMSSLSKMDVIYEFTRSKLLRAEKYSI